MQELGNAATLVYKEFLAEIKKHKERNAGIQEEGITLQGHVSSVIKSTSSNLIYIRIDNHIFLD